MFKQVKIALEQQFELMCKDQTKLFHIEPDRDLIWEIYLNNFDESVRQHHNCNCCKSFLRQYSGIVSIKDNKRISLWDIQVPEEYQKSVDAVNQYLNSLPITNVFLSTFDNLGTDKNAVHANPSVIWTHFYIKLPKRFVFRSSESVESVQGTMRDNKNVLQRSLNELTIDATETVLELIAQGSLYRGNEFEPMVKQFLTVKKQYDVSNNKDNFCWIQGCTLPQSITRIRNTSIGTLLTDLSNGVDLDQAVRSFERVVAPTNYKRPNAIVTPKMVAEAKKRLEELDMLESLDRRHANESDLSVNDIIFTDKSSQIIDVFGEMSKETKVNPKSLSKVEEVTIQEFIDNVVPTAKSIEVLLENKHLPNMVSLLTAVNSESKSMFTWNNQFSWSYTGGITDSMKERVKQAGGNVEGVLRYSIQWNEDGKSICDFDAHAEEPNGNIIKFNNYKGTKTSMSGMLDVDMIRPRNIGVENIVWTDISKMKYGTYKFIIHNYDNGRNTGFSAQIEFDGQIYDFSKSGNITGHTVVAEVTYDKNGFSIKSSLNGGSTIVNKTKWNLETNTFHKVNKLMFSPNHWNTSVGNKHFLFILENCISDESPRPFFNEFLKPELLKEKRVFETMAGKLKVEPTTNQLSGIGFSDTQPNSIYVRVEGKFKRTIKVNI